MIKGTFTMHGASKELEIKANIEKVNGSYTVSGTFEATVKDYNIKIPPLLKGNIAKIISVKFNFEYTAYES